MTDLDTFSVGDPLPSIATVVALDAFDVAVVWQTGRHFGQREIVDLAPAVLGFKIYAPLRDDPDLFRTIHVQDHGMGVAWGDGRIDMASTTIEDLAGETMTSQDFSAFMARHDFTLDRVAAELGISRRMAAYYRKQRKVPRYIALACAYVDLRTRRLSEHYQPLAATA